MYGFVVIADVRHSLVEAMRLAGQCDTLEFAAHRGEIARAEKIAGQTERVRGVRKRRGIGVSRCPVERVDQVWLRGLDRGSQPNEHSRKKRRA